MPATGCFDAAADTGIQITNAVPSPYGAGSACPSRSLSSFITQDKKIFNVIFDDNNSWVIGANTPAARRQPTCNYYLTVKFPPTCTQATFVATVRGTVHLQPAKPPNGAYFHLVQTFDGINKVTGQRDVQFGVEGDYAAGKDFKNGSTVTLQRDANKEQLETHFQLNTEMFIRDNGQHEGNDFGLYHLDFAIQNERSC